MDMDSYLLSGQIEYLRKMSQVVFGFDEKYFLNCKIFKYFLIVKYFQVKIIFGK